MVVTHRPEPGGHIMTARSLLRQALRLEALEDRLCLSQSYPYLYLASFGTNSIERYQERMGVPAPAPGQTGATFVPSGANGMNHPLAVLIGYDYNLYVTNLETDEVFRYDGLTGEPKPGEGLSGAPFTPSGQPHAPAGMVFGPDGNIYVANAAPSVSNVVRFDGKTGAFIDV